jgi:hypothetical protein
MPILYRPDGTFFTHVQASNGDQFTQDPAGRIVVPQSLLVEFISSGWTVAAEGAGPTRPTTGLYPGFPFFDTSLNAGTGRAIFRNAQNTAWIFADGSPA